MTSRREASRQVRCSTSVFIHTREWCLEFAQQI